MVASSTGLALLLLNICFHNCYTTRKKASSVTAPYSYCPLAVAATTTLPVTLIVYAALTFILTLKDLTVERSYRIDVNKSLFGTILFNRLS